MKFYSASLVFHFQFYFSLVFFLLFYFFVKLYFHVLNSYWLLEGVYYLVLPSCVLLYYLGISSYDILDISWCRYLFLSLLGEFLIFAYFRSVWSLVKFGGCRVASEELSGSELRGGSGPVIENCCAVGWRVVLPLRHKGMKLD